MDLLSHLTTTNNNSPSSSTTSSGTGDKLKKLQISTTTTTNKKENNNNTNLSYRSTSSLFNKSQIIPDQSTTTTTTTTKQDYEEILITIRKSEKGFGFELKNGILIVRVIPNSPAFNSGIKVGDLILKVNGTCVRSKDANEITSMIHESSSFVSLALQRKLLVAPAIEQVVEVLVENNDKLKNVTNQLINNSSSDNIDNLNDYENKILNELSESCREDTTNNNNENNNQFISGDDINLNESISSKTHRKQFSIPDDWIQPVSENNQVQKRDIKKSLSTINHSTNSKSYQTKSLSNIIMSKSTSDNELDQNNSSSSKQRMNNEADLFTIPYKDDLALLNDSNLEDSLTNDKPPAAWDLSLFTNYLQLVEKPVNMALFLNYLLSSSDSPKNLYFCLFADEMLNSAEKKETIHRWSYELYSTFLMPNAPLKLKISEHLILKLDDYFDKNTTANDNLKKIYDDIRQEAVEIVNLQLSKFREVNQMGLANLFQGGELAKACYLYKNDSDQVRQALANLFINYLQELVRLNDLNRISTDWNDSRLQEAQCSALLSSFATYIKRYNIPIKYLARYELEKIPSFVNRKFKPKKQSATSLRGHSFIEFSSACTRISCSKCKQAFWGIGNQGLICQKSKCEIKFHRSCLQTGVSFECQSKEKTIRTDYKEKLDSFQKILFGSKTKTKDDAVNDSSSSSQSSFFLQGFTGSTDSHLNHKKDYERQASIISSNFSISSSSGGSFTPDLTNNLDNHNLPVELAIKKFESMLNGKMTTTLSSNSVGTRSKLNDTLLQQTDEPISSTTATSDNLNFFSPNNPKSLYPAFNSMSNSKNIKIKRNSNLKGKEQACKRVGSLKSNDTNKKIKTHVHRSKSDPHPDEIKHAFTSELTTTTPPPPQPQPPPPQQHLSKRYSIDFSSVPEPISPKSK